MKVINPLLRLMAVPNGDPGTYSPPESGAGVGSKSPLPYRGNSLLGVFLTETVQYHH